MRTVYQRKKMMEEEPRLRGKRKREEEEDSQRTNDVPKTESPESKRKKLVTKSQSGKQRSRRISGSRQRKSNKPETFQSLYTIGEKLGEGGYGLVLAGTRVSDGLQVAIKFVPKNEENRCIRNRNDSRPIPVEVALMLMMSEPPVDNIIRLIQWFEEPELSILILERPQPCIDLKSFIHTHGGALSEEMARSLMLQVVEAVNECHKRGVVHRDIKDENVLINTETKEVKLIDFGCGDLIKKQGYDYYAGTFEYCPPEIFLTPRYYANPATVWSLGVLLFRMVCGFLPFKKEAEIIGGHLRFRDNLSNEFHHLVRWCLQLKPRSRPNLQQVLKHKWFKSSPQSGR